MALTAARTLQGNEMVRTIQSPDILHLPGDPGVTFTRGDRVAMSNGVLILATDSLADTIGRVMKTTVCPAATQAFPIGPNGPSDLDGAEAKTLIPIEMDVPAGVKVFAAPISNHCDYTVTSWTAGTRALVVATGFNTNDYPNSAIVYVYDGPGKGQINVIEAYTHATLTLTMHRAFAVAPTSASSVIVLAAAAAANGVGFMGRMDFDDENALEVDDGDDDGNAVLYCDFLKIQEYLKNLSVPYINANYSPYSAHNA
jgi:hypothetical protein